MDVSVAIGTFGSPLWVELAESRAIPSAKAQGVPVVHRHGSTLAVARNEALALVDTEYTIHLDADDELDEGYVEAMAKGTADLRGPAIQQMRDKLKWGEASVPKVWSHTHDCTGECLRHGNWLCIGTCVKTALAREIGWEEFGWSEDWALFARMWKAGATVEAIPEAIYIAYWSQTSRNRVTRHTGVRWHREIERAVWPEEAA